MNLKLIIPVSLLVVFLVSACELPRPGGVADDIAPEIPGVASPEGAVSPVATAEVAPTVGGVAPPDIPEISPEGVPAVAAPEAGAVERGTVLIKLTQPAAIQARSAEPDAQGIMTTDIGSLDRILEEIGADKLEPVVEAVASAVSKDIGPFSTQVADVSQLFSVGFSPDINPQEVVDRLSQDPDTVEYAEPNYIAGITAEPWEIPAPFTPNDQYFNFQWHLEAIQMPAAWDRARGTGVTVAVIDTGIDFRAPDLAIANTRRLTGYNFFDNNSDPTDDHGHGTHVAGTIAQDTDNGIGVAGVAFDARLLPVKVLGPNGEGSYEDVIKGIIYAVDQGAKVINLSLAGRNGSRALEEAVEYAHNQGVVVVAAAGNSSSSVEFPAAYDDFVIAVGATRYNKAVAPYSNLGPEIDLMAPGGDTSVDQNQDGFGDGVLQQTISSSGSGYSYRFFEGTSMASPHVAGVAALLLSLKPGTNPDEIKNVMAQTADSEDIGPRAQIGAGLVQAADAVAVIVGPPKEPTATYTPSPTVTTPPVGEDTPTHTPTYTPTPTPTFTPTPTITPVSPGPITPPPTPPPGELLLNGGFEGGDGWTFGDTPIRGDFETGIVRSGSRSARLGDTTGRDKFSFSSVWQRVTIPAEAGQVTLNAYVYPVSQDRPGADQQIIMILNDHFRPLRTLSRELSDSQTWELRSYDLSDLRGQTIYVYFSVFNRGRSGRLSAMYVDDVSLNWSP